MEIALEEFRNCDIGLNAASLPSLSSSKIYLKMEKITLLWKTFKLLTKGNLVAVLQMEQYVFCITITYSQSLAFKVGELNHFLMHTIKTETAGSK